MASGRGLAPGQARTGWPKLAPGLASPCAPSARASSAPARRPCAGRELASRTCSGSATATYLRACARCGCGPVPGVVDDLTERGALTIDLGLCTGLGLQVVCVLLREAPSGLHQIVLRNGLGAKNRVRNATRRRRCRQDEAALEVAPLRLLASALAAFITARGSQISVLDLAGAPIGREVPTTLAPIAAALRGARTRELRWLGLSGCRLGDRGLAMLLPWLGGAANLLPRLESLSLAWNGLADVRLIDALLRARARLCYDRRAAPLHMLELSGNPRLCDTGAPVSSGSAQLFAPSARRDRPSNALSRPGVARPRADSLATRRSSLVRCVASAIVDGLPLRVLRLRRLHLDEGSLAPLLQLLRAEVLRCTGSNGRLVGASGFCLEEVDLAENWLAPSILEDLHDSLRLLRRVREGPSCTQTQEQPPPSQPSSWAPKAAQHSPSRTRRSASEPPQSLRNPLARESSPEYRVGRDAMSEGERGVEDEADFVDPGGPARLLGRSVKRREFRCAAKAIAKRRPKSAVGVRHARVGEEATIEAEMNLAGVLGVAAGQSLVRQALLAEIEGESALGRSGFQTQARQNESVPDRPTRQGAADADDEDVDLHLWPGGPAVASPMSSRRPDVPGTTWCSNARASFESVGEDAEVEAEAELLRAERLAALRADVLGALSPQKGNCFKNVCVPNLGETIGIEPHQQLDEMRQEALMDLCKRMTRDGVSEGGIRRHSSPPGSRNWGGWFADPRVAAGG